MTTRPVVLLLAALALAAPAWAQRQDPAFLNGLRYRFIGPTQGGRVTAVTGVPGRPGSFYMGATGGGVWKTSDWGQSWQNVSDGSFTSPSIGAIRTARTNPDLVWVGTGSDGIRSNIIRGDGVYRSTDGGRTWRHMGLARAGLIGAVEIHPTNPDIVFVAAVGQPFGPNPERGVFRTRDGGATWERVLFLSDSTGAVDLEFAPDNPDEIYAAAWRTMRRPWTIISGAHQGGVWKSTDGGTTWNRLGGGLPTGLVGKADLAVSPAAPNRLYLLIEAEPGGGLYRSDDRGASFHLVSTQRGILDRPFYYTNVDADPSNADVVYVSATGFWRSADGGRTFERRSTPHGDNHDLWIDPADPNVMIQSNDGGANVSRDGGRTWSTQDNQPTAELYQVALDDQWPYWAYAGQQDNGSAIAVPSLPAHRTIGGPTELWRDVGGCETGPAVPKPGRPDVIYTNCKGQFGRYNWRTGQERRYWVGAEYIYGANPRNLKYRFQRVVPIHVSPHDPNTVYHASQFLHRTRDEGVTWETISPDLTANEPDKQVISGAPITRDITGEEYYSTIYTVRESPRQRGVIWVGANDGPVHVTTDGGKTWRNVTPPDLPPGGRVQGIEPSPHRAEKAYIAVYRYLLDDWRPYIYRTTDFGRTWTLLTTGENGVPADVPARVVREDRAREGLLYAGTDHGVYLSFDDGATWQRFQRNLPVTPVTDIALTRDDLVLSTMGRGFWVVDNLAPLHHLGQLGGPPSPAVLLPPRVATRMRYQPARGPGPEYPVPGAQLDYLVGPGAVGRVALEVLNPDGTVLRTLDAPREPGAHRVAWDLTAPGTPGGGRGGGRGPMVPPGTYTVRLRLGDWSASERLVVRADPRVTTDGVTDQHLVEQYRLARRVQTLLGQARRASAQVRQLLDRTADTAAKETLRTAQEELVTAPGAYPTPMLLDQIDYLYGMLTGADQRPGKDASSRLGELERRYGAVVERLRAVPGWRE